MPPPALCPCRAVPRPSAVVNAEIRQLAGRERLSEAERERMARLWAEYGAAVEAEERAA